LAPVVAFGAYIGAANATFQEFDASRMFASLILINLLASPLIRLLQIIPSFGAAMGCFTRLEQFLKRPEGVESRKSLADISERSSGQFEIEETHPEKCSNYGKKCLPEVFTTRPILSIRNGDFGWEQTVLKNINLVVNSGEHIAITGPVGCGKSLLLLAILGEIEPKEGSVHIGRADIGYCSQNAWLENSTARENAFRCSTGDEQWEKTVIEACALRDFFDSQTPDNTIGSGGMKLSGGEKQRLV
jgi:ABC-type multidrug transport system fused ATPase/permease subunit